MSALRGLLTSPKARLFAGRAGAVAVDAVTSIVLLRWCGPEAGGAMALAATLSAVFAALGDFGASTSLVSDRDRSPARFGAAVLVATVMAGAMVLVGVLSGPAVLPLFGATSAAAGLAFTASMVAVAANTLAAVPVAAAQVSGRFGLVAGLPFVTSLVAAAVALVFARVHGPGVEPLALRAVSGAMLACVAWWIWCRPVLGRPARADVRSVAAFGAGQSGFSVVNWFARNADNLVVSRLLGDVALAQYSVAYRVLGQPVSLVGSVVHAVEYPRLAALAPDWAAVVRALGAVMAQVAVVSFPVAVAVAAVSEDLVGVLLGARWSDAAFPLRVLAVLSVVQLPWGLTGIAFQVSRRTDAMAAWALLSTPAIVTSFVAGVSWGIAGVSVAYALTSLVLLPLLLRRSASVLGARARDLVTPVLGAWWKSSPAALAFVVAQWVMVRVDVPPIVRLLVLGAVVTLWSARGLRGGLRLES